MMLKKEFLEKCAALREVILVPTSGLSTVYALSLIHISSQ